MICYNFPVTVQAFIIRSKCMSHARSIIFSHAVIKKILFWFIVDTFYNCINEYGFVSYQIYCVMSKVISY